jgi:hydrogenase-4 component F
MIVVIGLVALIATSYTVAYLRAELDHGHTTPEAARSYGALVQVFIAAMLAAAVANNLGVVWVAVEATTIATAFLVGHRRTRASLEASWKYVVIGSVGVALAFLGTVLVYFASRHAGGDGQAALNWTALVAAGPRLNPGVMRLAVGLLVLGFGTKVGLAPMHTWLPDAHSQAPAPVSALMSGVLLSVAFYALLRYKVIADSALGTQYLRGLLVAAALLSLAVAASLLIAQRDYKRLLAYSSIEHMGLIALGAAIGSPLAIAAVLLHILGHGLGKAVLFCGSGEILLTTGTTEIAGVRGLLAQRPALGGTFGLGLLALLGLPPFSLFASELAIARAGFADGLGWAVAIALVLMLVIFAAVARHAQQMLLGEAPADLESHRTTSLAVAPLIAGLAVSAALGVSIWPIERLLHAAARVVAR